VQQGVDGTHRDPFAQEHAAVLGPDGVPRHRAEPVPGQGGREQADDDRDEGDAGDPAREVHPVRIVRSSRIVDTATPRCGVLVTRSCAKMDA
jgi:hypothetical protein